MVFTFTPLTPQARTALVEYESLYERWRVADEAARAAERLVEHQWSCSAAGQPPDLALEARAMELRAQAWQLAQEALACVRSSPI
jgi:hypothetical protein